MKSKLFLLLFFAISPFVSQSQSLMIVSPSSDSTVGNVGSFNFMFNAPTEYPNVLVETAFLSNPEEEEKLLNENFQQQIAEGIVRGLKNFLAAQEAE